MEGAPYDRLTRLTLPTSHAVGLGIDIVRAAGACDGKGSGVVAVSAHPAAASSGSNELAALEAQVGVTFRDIGLLREALTHPSYANEHADDATATNERLEFLGDAVLGLVVAETLFQRFPEVQEGRLTEWRSQLVCGPTLARIAEDVLGLGTWLCLGRGEEQTGGRAREGNLERAYEAIIGAIYLDQGLDEVRRFVTTTLHDDLDALTRDPDILNPKGALQQIAQDRFGRPEYVLLTADGPEHERHFNVEVRIAGEVLGHGDGTSKQEAEKEAAREALPILRARLADSTSQNASQQAPDGGHRPESGA